MKTVIRITAVIFFFSFALSGCYYDKESELYPNAACGDTTVVTYDLSIKPIMVANCNVCHSAANPSGNVITSTYEGCSVVAKSGLLWYSVNWEGPRNTQMPQGATDTLSICDRTKIRKWIDAGSPNN
ncbi:MAG: hypothetical protein NTW16_07640 [Bacteroidetes bacterium]|nr:hypothetical protein [Bacteroidota bacterium]